MKILEKCLIPFVTILIPISKMNNSLGDECWKLLKCLVVEHVQDFEGTIKLLDPFPSDTKFSHIQSVYNDVRYNGTTFKLKEEIEYFLTTGLLMGGMGRRTEGLLHLKKQLSDRKLELKQMYDDLHKVRGFSEDCQKSLLHQLVCMLVKLSLSADYEESVEATKCLGELGSANLLTMVLQIEQKYENEQCSGFELVTKLVTKIIVNYTVDKSFDVMEVANATLFYVLDCKEAKSILQRIDEEKLNKPFLTPFVSSRVIKSATDYSLKNNFKTQIENKELWCPSVPITHEDWITNLVCTLLETFSDKCYLKNLIPMCKVQAEFSEQLLPFLVYLIINCDHSELVSTQIAHFFSTHWMHNTNENKGADVIAINKLSVQCMLNVVNFIRLRANMENRREFSKFNINYLHAAQAARFCTAYFTALLYIELWCQEKVTKMNTSFDNMLLASPGLTYLDMIVQKEEEPGTRKSLQHTLRECYQKVGETDALYTCESMSIIDNEFEIEHYENLQQWDKALLHYDIKISNGEIGCVSKMQTALKKCSLFEIPVRIENHADPQFDCAWRLSQWDINESVTKNSNSYEKYKYFALKAVHNCDKSSFQFSQENARSCIVDGLKHASLECSENLYEPLTELQCLSELEEFMKAQDEKKFEVLVQKWKTQDTINPNHFKYIEPIYSQRGVILSNLVCSKFPNLKQYFVEMQLKFAGVARTTGNANAATRTISKLHHNSGLTSDLQASVKFEEAQLRWIDNKKYACQILRHLLSDLPSCRLRADVLRLYGTWMMETCSENPLVIIKSYFIKSLNQLHELGHSGAHNVHETYEILAHFADSQYQQVQAYIKSSIFERKKENMEKSKLTALSIKSQSKYKITTDEQRSMIIHEKQSAIDQTEIDNTYKERNMYLLMAMKYYLRNLEISDNSNVHMFRVLSLLLENRQDTELKKLFNENISKIPSYKFIPILPQMIPHITSSSDDPVGYQINAIVERCAKEHPHHALPFILSLANSHKDRDYDRSKTNTLSNEVRISAAKELIITLKKKEHLRNVITKMEFLSEALIHLAYIDQEECSIDRNKEHIIPTSCRITRIKKFDDILLPTHTLDVKKNRDYSNIVGVHSFCKTFTNVGGLNAPKRIYSIGTDGLKRNQLVKGKDDLRQDAVMQQVFNIMNSLLACNKQTAGLLIRTYKIVPLSQRSGILEWVDNSMPIGEYLVGDGKSVVGAHTTYNPDDMSPVRCRIEFKNAAKMSHDDKLKVYNNICKKFHPVFHKFFENSFVQPAVWYERRRAYTYSVATTSMIGYILGLGDRHVSNILIDKSTAEVIHIDFGIAFEQGLVLPTPETVPFRLTRDMEAGLGVSGIEGVFRKSCERTLEMLRKNSKTIVSILEVLLYDPLYAWTVTPSKAYKRQLSDDHEQGDATDNTMSFIQDENVNATAERTLLRLRQKLQGITEAGTLTNIEGQVQKLLQQARDPSNLCRLFHGWQPYL